MEKDFKPINELWHSYKIIPYTEEDMENYLEIVQNLNEKIEEKFDFKNFSFYFNYSTDGYHHSILFNDSLTLWFSENETREFYEEYFPNGVKCQESGEYEDLEQYVWKEFVKYTQELNKLII